MNKKEMDAISRSIHAPHYNRPRVAIKVVDQPTIDSSLPVLKAEELQALAWFLRELMPVGINYNKRRFSEFINFLCSHFNIERAQLINLMARPRR